MQQNTEFLTDALFEFHTLKRLLTDAVHDNFPVDDGIAPLLLLLVKTTDKKLKHYQEKYKFEVATEDMYYVENLPDFVTFPEKEAPTDQPRESQ